MACSHDEMYWLKIYVRCTNRNAVGFYICRLNNVVENILNQHLSINWMRWFVKVGWRYDMVCEVTEKVANKNQRLVKLRQVGSSVYIVCTLLFIYVILIFTFTKCPFRVCVPICFDWISILFCVVARNNPLSLALSSFWYCFHLAHDSVAFSKMRSSPLPLPRKLQINESIFLAISALQNNSNWKTK